VRPQYHALGFSADYVAAVQETGEMGGTQTVLR
jgi:hypothetical protein